MNFPSSVILNFYYKFTGEACISLSFQYSIETCHVFPRKICISTTMKNKTKEETGIDITVILWSLIFCNCQGITFSDKIFMSSKVTCVRYGVSLICFQ